MVKQSNTEKDMIKLHLVFSIQILIKLGKLYSTNLILIIKHVTYKNIFLSKFTTSYYNFDEFQCIFFLISLYKINIDNTD